MDLALEAEVQCSDGHVGHTTSVIVNPLTAQVSHLVVKESAFPFIERTVPLQQVVESSGQMVRLKCRIMDLSQMDSLVEYDYLPGCEPGSGTQADEYWTWPYLLPEELLLPLEYEDVPSGELSVHRGVRVEGTDGGVGQVKRFLVDESGHITHLVVREGHLWAQSEIVVPVSKVNRFTEQTIYLNLERSEIEALPKIRVGR